MDTSRDLGKVAMIIREECTAPFKATHDDGESFFGMRSNIVDDELSPPSKFVGDISHIQENFVDDMKQHISQCKDDLVLKLEDYRSLDNELLAETNCCVQPRCVTPDVDHVSSGDDDNTKGFSMNEIITSVQGFCEQRAPSECLFSLPVDALHCIASFVTASDWASFGCVSTVATSICRAVFRRVRMHGFHCATEVINAWVSNHFVYRGALPCQNAHMTILSRNSASTRTLENLQLFTSHQVYQSIHFRWGTLIILSFGEWGLKSVKWNTMDQIEMRREDE